MQTSFCKKKRARTNRKRKTTTGEARKNLEQKRSQTNKTKKDSMKREKHQGHRLVICGSRTFEDYGKFEKELNKQIEGLKVDLILSGGCRGVDAMAKNYAQLNGYEHKELKANWRRFGRGAGPMRNTELAKQGTSTIGFWDGESKGTYDMLKKAKNHEHEHVSYYHTRKHKTEKM